MLGLRPRPVQAAKIGGIAENMSDSQFPVDSQHIPYPWQQPLWQRFLKQLEQQRLPHAMLLSGQEGIGKWHYAQAMANFLLCVSPHSGLPCGQCRGCQLIAAGTHPDKHVLIPEAKGKQIKIDQIRQFLAQAASTAQQGGRKVVVIAPVEQLNMNAANALLKNLEEPSAETFFILLSHVISGVMPTIRSRCHVTPLPVPPVAQAKAWLAGLGHKDGVEEVLALTSGAPLAAKALLDVERAQQLATFFNGLQQIAESPGELVTLTPVSEWLEVPMQELLNWWLQLIHRLVVGRFSSSSLSTSHPSEGPVFIAPLQAIEQALQSSNQQWLMRFADKLMQIKKQLLEGSNPNPQLLLEELVLDWYAIIRRGKL